MKCIFCLKEKEPSDEHVIPISIGGGVVIRNVCRDCNNALNKRVDEPFNKTKLVQLFRRQCGLGGRKNNIPNSIFSGKAEDASGTKLVIDNDFGVRVIPKAISRSDEEGKTIFEFSGDSREMNPGDPGYEKAVKLFIGNGMSESSARKEVDDAIARGPVTSRSIERIRGCFASPEFVPAPQGSGIMPGFPCLYLECVKIAYELWFRKFGYGWVEQSETARHLRNALFRYGFSEIKVGTINSQLPLGDPSREHFAVSMLGYALIRLFDKVQMVECERNIKRYMLPPDGPFSEAFPIEY